MLNKHTGQRDLYDEMVFERLVPQDHLLVQIATHIDFTFVYEIVKDCGTGNIFHKRAHFLGEWGSKLLMGKGIRRVGVTLANLWYPVSIP